MFTINEESSDRMDEKSVLWKMCAPLICLNFFLQSISLSKKRYCKKNDKKMIISKVPIRLHVHKGTNKVKKKLQFKYCPSFSPSGHPTFTLLSVRVSWWNLNRVRRVDTVMSEEQTDLEQLLRPFATCTEAADGASAQVLFSEKWLQVALRLRLNDEMRRKIYTCHIHVRQTKQACFIQTQRVSLIVCLRSTRS